MAAEMGETFHQGATCPEPESWQQRWGRHFTKGLHVQSKFDEEELRRVRQRPLRPEMAELPQEENVVEKPRNR